MNTPKKLTWNPQNWILWTEKRAKLNDFFRWRGRWVALKFSHEVIRICSWRCSKWDSHLKLRHLNLRLQNAGNYCWWFRNPKANHPTCMKPCKIWYTPEVSQWNLKIDPWKRKFLLENIIFRFHVKLWECIFSYELVSRISETSTVSLTCCWHCFQESNDQ